VVLKFNFQNGDTMKKILICLSIAIAALTLPVTDAEAKRLGGGKSVGMQRDMTAARPASPPPAQQAAPMPHANPAPTAAAPAAQPNRSWLGPVAGLAAGLGIGALLGSSGMFGGGMGGLGGIMEMLMLAAVVFFGFKLFQAFRAQKNAAPVDPMQYAGVGGPGMAPMQNEPIDVTPTHVPAASPVLVAPAALVLPADFDKEAFLRVAKVNFIRLQAAFDAGNLDDLREFTAPELFAEIRMDLTERAGKSQQTDVVTLDAELLDLVTQANHHVASVRFHGLIREEVNVAAEPVDEIWHLSKAVDGSRGWVVSGIQQQ
jgi:predicted lipid-binding transport protein (Tim44 family)